jgi:hypothetical protein
MEDPKTRQDGEPVPKNQGKGGVGTPFAGDSSTSGVPISPNAGAAECVIFVGLGCIMEIPD